MMRRLRFEDGTFWSPAGQLLATTPQLRLAGV
jgi:hypothetical protein